MSTFFEDREERAGKRLRVSFKFSDSMEMCIVGDTIDELITGLEGLNNAGLINEFANRFDLTEEQFGRLDNMILATRNPEEIERYLKNHKYQINNVENFEKVLLELGCIHLMVTFSQRYQGKYFNQIEDAVVASNDYSAIFAFSRIKGADLKKIKEIYWNTKSLYYCIHFYNIHKNTPDLFSADDLRLLEEMAIENKEADSIYDLAKAAINEVDIDKLQEAIINTGSTHYILKFAILICDNRDISKLQEEIINNGDASQIFEFARDVKGADIKALYRAIKKKGDKYYVRRFRENIEYNFFWF